MVGTAEESERQLNWLRARSRELREELGRRIVLKYMPRLEYVADHSAEQGTRVLRVLDEIDRQSPPPAEDEP